MKLASKKELFVDKYSYGHEKLRKKTRRMCKEGLLVCVLKNKQGFWYKSIDAI